MATDTRLRITAEHPDGSYEVMGYPIVWGALGLDMAEFQPDTDLGDDVVPHPRALLLDHAVPVQDEQGTLDLPQRIGLVIESGKDTVGRWIKAMVPMVEKYRKLLEALKEKIRLGEAGLSDQALAANARAVLLDDGRALWRTFHVAETSVTLIPAEPRSLDWERLLFLKWAMTAAQWRAFSEAHGLREDAAASGEQPTQSTQERTMEEMKTPQAPSAPAAPATPEAKAGAPAMQITQEQLDAMISRAVSAAVNEITKTERRVLAPVAEEPANSVKVGENRAESKPWRSFGEQFAAMNEARLGRSFDPRLQSGKLPAGSGKTALPVISVDAYRAIHGGNVTVGSEGGFLVGMQAEPGVWSIPWDTGAILKRVDKRPALSFANGRVYAKAFDETSRAAGYRFGGIRVYHKGEGQAPTSQKPSYRLLTWSPIDKGIRGLTTMTEEEMRIPEAAGEDMLRAWRSEIIWTVEHDIQWGTGAGQAEGFMVSGAKYEVTATDATEILLAEDLANMRKHVFAGYLSGYCWLYTPELLTDLITMQIGSYPVFLPQNGMSGKPFSQILDLPAIETEHAAAAGTPGDIALVCLNPFYRVYDLGDTETAYSAHLYFDTAEGTWRFMYWMDGQSMLTDYIRPANGGTNYLSPFITLSARS